MDNYKDITKIDWTKTAIYLILYIAAIIIGAIFLIPMGPNGIVIWIIVIVIGGLLLLSLWHTRTYAYRCPICGYEFEISWLKDLFSIQGADSEGGWKLIKCPECGKRSKKRVIKKD